MRDLGLGQGWALALVVAACATGTGTDFGDDDSTGASGAGAGTAAGGTGGGTTGSGGGTTGGGGGTTGGGGGGCELGTVDNCGFCGDACAPDNVSSPICVQGGCAYNSCVANFQDCDGDTANGCESDELSDVDNCGACATPCDPADFTNVDELICAQGSCDWVSCAQDFDDCDGLHETGCERAIDTLTDCGACDSVCAPDNVDAANCVAGVCGYGACLGTFDDCDADASNGCEVDTANDPLHCGGCNIPCSGGESCYNSQCTLGVLITTTDGYGHHGACSGWNGCGSPDVCALWACQWNGFSGLLSYGTTAACDSGQFTTCHLFNSQGDLDQNWGTSCAVMGVGDIWCTP